MIRSVLGRYIWTKSSPQIVDDHFAALCVCLTILPKNLNWRPQHEYPKNPRKQRSNSTKINFGLYSFDYFFSIASLCPGSYAGDRHRNYILTGKRTTELDKHPLLLSSYVTNNATTLSSFLIEKFIGAVSVKRSSHKPVSLQYF